VQPYLFYKCQFGDGCAGRGGGLVSRTISNQAWLASHTNGTAVTELPTAAGVSAEPEKCRVGMPVSSARFKVVGMLIVGLMLLGYVMGYV